MIAERLEMKALFTLLFVMLYSLPCLAEDHLSLNFKEADLRQALQTLAQLTNQNIILEDGVQGKLTLKLEADSFEQALDLISQAKQLQYSNQAGVTVIHSPGKNPTLESVALNYRQAQELAEELKPLFSGKLLAEPLTNSLIYTGEAMELLRLKQLLKQLDIPSPQVCMEAKIIALNEETSKNMGLRWNWDTLPQNKNTSSDSNSYGGNYNFWRGNSLRFNATLNALIANGKAKILAKPSILTLPGKEATLFIGDHIPVQTEKRDSRGSYTTTEYVDAGIKLKYTPLISQDGRYITAAVHTEVATASLVSEMNNYKITSRTAETNVRLADQETLVIGGLINEEEQKNMQRVPLLSKLPLVGFLFRSHTSRKSKVEVIMLLTPKIVPVEEKAI